MSTRQRMGLAVRKMTALRKDVNHTSMAYQHTNRRGDVYYIQAKGRGGKIAYSAARKPTGTMVDRLPKDYEIYEKPENAQVFVRKIKPTLILPSERIRRKMG